MSKLCAILLLSIGMLVSGQAAQADSSFTFTALPSSGAISGAPGSTVGWGYSIMNDSSTQWLVLSDLNTTESFLNGTPDNNIFDYPIIAPDQTVTVSFNALAGTGLYEFTWNSDAPTGFTNSGEFDLTGFFCADSSLGGCSTTNVDEFAPYSVTATPEPTPLLLLCTGLTLCWLMRKKLAHSG